MVNVNKVYLFHWYYISLNKQQQRLRSLPAFDAKNIRDQDFFFSQRDDDAGKFSVGLFLVLVDPFKS